jgi:hypothetical protein
VACAVGDFVTRYLYEKWTDYLDAIQVTIDLAFDAARQVNAIFDFFLGWIPEVPNIYDDLQEIVAGAVATGIDSIKAQDTVDWRIARKCDLYCRLLVTGGNFGDTRAVILDGWQNDIYTHSNPVIGVPFAAFISLLPLSMFQIRARIANNNVGECDDCECATCVTVLECYNGFDCPIIKTGCHYRITSVDDTPDNAQLILFRNTNIGVNFQMTNITLSGVADYSAIYTGSGDPHTNVGFVTPCFQVVLAWSPVGSGEKWIEFDLTD